MIDRGVVDRSRRAALGQWFTPPALVDFVVGLVGASGRVLDPACGDGAFLARLGGARGALGIELDPATAAAARQRVPQAAIHRGSFFSSSMRVELGVVDTIVGNPPWVRASRLDGEARGEIAAALAADWPEMIESDRRVLATRADLAAPFLLRALATVRPEGRVALVVSTALLDADYADALWRAVLAAARPLALVTAPGERWFGDAAVNAMVVVLERRKERPATSDRQPATGNQGAGGGVALARLRVGTREAAERTVTVDELATVAEVRRGEAARPETWSGGLRAPAVWPHFVAAAGSALVPLGELATIRRGITSGANQLFYLSRAKAKQLGLEAGALAPVVRSPYNGSPASIHLDPDATPLVALALPGDADLATMPRARAWIDHNAALADRPSLRGRTPWWSLRTRPARLFLAKAYGPRFVQRLAPMPMLGDQRVYAVEPRPGVDLEVLAALLNSTWTALAIESLGRASMGNGAIEWTVADASRLPVLDPRRAEGATVAALGEALAEIARRPIEHVALERERADRGKLDAAAAGLAPSIVGLRPRVLDELVAAVKLRDRWLLPELDG